MITIKGILYTVAGAVIAGIVAGNLLTSGKEKSLSERLKKTVRDWLDHQKNKNKLRYSKESANQRAEFDQAHSTGSPI